MSNISLEKASLDDAEKLTELMKKTFDEEAKKWLSPHENIVDYNIQPPGYSSVEMTKYMIEELDYYRVQYNEELVGGIIVTITGKAFGRIDRIFIAPEYQGRGMGSKVIQLIEEEFPQVRTWDLETSSRQVTNHYFYKKMGYETTLETEDEYCFIKRKEEPATNGKAVVNKDLSNSQYENNNMKNTECYQVNLEGSSFCNSSLMNAQFSNCNLSSSSFQNINLRHSLYADLNLSNSKFRLVTLGGVSFMDTDLGDAGHPISFERCDLQGTKIKNSTLRNVEINNSDLTGMRIDGIPVEELLEAYYQVKNKKPD
ncbi:GNAT family N-acetyltransferase [Bacillus salacetis]|uniref:GNAT family N-acetyltransferase n=1 Tax=Bacillus salacetis TaxID=2315464 RepID=A0A3A1QW99_9BACI|nr:GNAT family N-acetyltransferase [Bacillus salacetis]RIW32510.1 GNAT family N-acetyltransferase [Bacillus salacetis]